MLIFGIDPGATTGVAHIVGDNLRPIQLRFAREALGLDGRMAQQGGAA